MICEGGPNKGGPRPVRPVVSGLKFHGEAGVAQLVERHVANVQVDGSNPFTRSTSPDFSIDSRTLRTRQRFPGPYLALAAVIASHSAKAGPGSIDVPGFLLAVDQDRGAAEPVRTEIARVAKAHDVAAGVQRLDLEIGKSRPRQEAPRLGNS